jgi:archaellum component FlaF (FlaF/FlaG flagellin family)
LKRILLLSAIALVALISSCKKDPKPEELIIGKWKVTKLIVDTEDVIASSIDSKTEVEVEFTKSGTIIFNVKITDYTVFPALVEEIVSPGTYSWNGDKITISVDDSGTPLSITGIVDLTENRLIINATSGDIVDFFSLLEADKI